MTTGKVKIDIGVDELTTGEFRIQVCDDNSSVCIVYARTLEAVTERAQFIADAINFYNENHK